MIKYYTEGISFKDTIYNCTNIFDFCKMVKAKGCKFKTVWYDSNYNKHVENQGKVVRYFIAKSKGHHGNVKLMKYLPPLKTETYTEIYKKKIPDQMDIFDIPEVEDHKVISDRISNVEAESYVEIFNKYEEKPFEEYGIDLTYYVNECKKITKSIK